MYQFVETNLQLVLKVKKKSTLAVVKRRIK
jgi:hypothetical protein